MADLNLCTVGILSSNIAQILAVLGLNVQNSAVQLLAAVSDIDLADSSSYRLIFEFSLIACNLAFIESESFLIAAYEVTLRSNCFLKSVFTVLKTAYNSL